MINTEKNKFSKLPTSSNKIRIFERLFGTFVIPMGEYPILCPFYT